jgi:hypothetical protein
LGWDEKGGGGGLGFDNFYLISKVIFAFQFFFLQTLNEKHNLKVFFEKIYTTNA